MPGGGEPGHVHPDLGDDHRSGHRPPAGDLIQAGDRLGERGDHLLDGRLELGDVGAQGVHAGEHLGQQHPVVVGEVPGERLDQCRDLAAHRAPRELRERLGVPLAGDQVRHHVPPETPKMQGEPKRAQPSRAKR